MTKKDHELLAAAVYATSRRIETAGGILSPHEKKMQQRGVRRTAAHLCLALSEENPEFDQQRFLKACGY